MKRMYALMLATSLCAVSTRLLANEWFAIEHTAGYHTETVNKLRSMNLSCDFVSEIDNKGGLLAACRNSTKSTPGLKLYTLSEQTKDYLVHEIQTFGDATHAKLTAYIARDEKNTSHDLLPNKLSTQILLIDISDEGGCYGTEVYRQENGVPTHLGTIELFTLKYTSYRDNPSFEARSVCLGPFAQIVNKKKQTLIEFGGIPIYRLDPNKGVLEVVKGKKLRYQLKANKLRSLDKINH